MQTCTHPHTHLNHSFQIETQSNNLIIMTVLIMMVVMMVIIMILGFYWSFAIFKVLYYILYTVLGFSGSSVGKEFTGNVEDTLWVRSLGQEDPLEEVMATHSSILAWRILWTEEPGGLQSVGSQKRQTQLSMHTPQRHCLKLAIFTINQAIFFSFLLEW